MPFDYFLRIDEIPGEATNKAHKDEIVVESFNIRTETPAISSRSDGGGATNGRPLMEGLDVTHGSDKASPALFAALTQGKVIKSGQLTVVADPGVDVLVYKLEGILVTSIETVGESRGRPLETVTLIATRVEIVYTPRTATGATGGQLKAGWNFAQNKKFP